MPSDRSRRDFLATIAASAASAAAASLVPFADADAADADADAPPATSAPFRFDDSWTARVKAAKHAMVFDGTEVGDGMMLTQPWIYRAGYREALGVTGSAVVPIVVLRHAAIPLAIDDALWAKYGIGALRGITDPTTKQPAERNPWSRTPAGTAVSPDLVAMLGPETDPTVEGVIRSGGIVLACNLALGRVARGIAAKVGADAATIQAELRDGVVPGLIVQPSGVYAFGRAQEMGAAALRST